MTTGDPTPTPSTQPAPSANSHWSGGRIVALIFASLVGLLGIGLLLGGIGVIGAHSLLRDDDGFFTSSTEQLESNAYAITAEDIDLGTDPADWAPEELLGTARVRVENSGDGRLFVGVAREGDVDSYLRGVAHSEIRDFVDGDPRYEDQAGNRRPQPPGKQDFWEAKSEGAGERVLDWDVSSGIWAIVVMNADASPGVSVDAEAGIKLDWLIWVGVGLAVVGLLFTATAIVLILLISRHASAGAAQAPSAAPGA